METFTGPNKVWLFLGQRTGAHCEDYSMHSIVHLLCVTLFVQKHIDQFGASIVLKTTYPLSNYQLLKIEKKGCIFIINSYI